MSACLALTRARAASTSYSRRTTTGELAEPMWYRTEPDGTDALYYTFRSRTYGVFLFWRAFLGEGGSTADGVAIIERTRVYPWGQRDSAPEMVFPDATDVEVQMLIPNVTRGDEPYRYFENLADFIDYEYVEPDQFDMRGMLRTLGIVKGQPFEPDERLQDILAKASTVAYNMSRANRYATRIEDARIWPDRHYEQGYIGERGDFIEESYTNLDARAAFFHFAYSASEAMVKHLVDAGAKYPLTFRDADGDPLQGENTYTLHVPPDPPARLFWSVAIYSAFDAAGLDNGQRFPSINSLDDIEVNDDGSVDFTFAPELPTGHPESTGPSPAKASSSSSACTAPAAPTTTEPGNSTTSPRPTRSRRDPTTVPDRRSGDAPEQRLWHGDSPAQIRQS